MSGPAVRLLGPVTAVGRAGETVTLGGPRQRAVLAVLALRAGRPVGVDAIVDGVWGDDPPVTVTNTIQVYVSALRKALAAHALWTAPSRAALTPIHRHEGYDAMAAIGAADPSRTAQRWLDATTT